MDESNRVRKSEHKQVWACLLYLFVTQLTQVFYYQQCSHTVNPRNNITTPFNHNQSIKCKKKKKRLYLNTIGEGMNKCINFYYYYLFMLNCKLKFLIPSWSYIIYRVDGFLFLLPLP